MGRTPKFTIAGMVLAVALAGCQNPPQRQNYTQPGTPTGTQPGVRPQTSTGWNPQSAPAPGGGTPQATSAQLANQAYPANPNATNYNLPNQPSVPSGQQPAANGAQPVAFGGNSGMNMPASQSNARLTTPPNPYPPYQAQNPVLPGSSGGQLPGTLMQPNLSLPDNAPTNAANQFGSAPYPNIQPPPNTIQPGNVPAAATSPGMPMFH